MHRGRIGCRRWALSLAVGSVVACATMAATASSALAGGVSASTPTPSTSRRRPRRPGTRRRRRRPDEHILAGIGSRRRRTLPPLGFRVTRASLPTGASGQVHVLFNIVLLDHRLSPGSTLHVSVTAPRRRGATTPSAGGSPMQTTAGCSARTCAWTGRTAASPLVTCVTATGLKFAGQPNDALVNDTITGTRRHRGRR